jgi:hypothetical protein
MTPRRAAILLALGLAALAGGASAGHGDERQAARETEFDGLHLLGEIMRGVHFGYVEIDTRPSEGMYVCGALRRGDAAAAAATVATALQSLPDGALSKLRLRYVIVCGGATAGGQRIGGIPVPPLDLLMLDASDDLSMQHRTLHELYHLIEYRFGGIGDAEWTAQFGGGYSNQYPGMLRKAPLGSGKPGFATAYGETYPHEDRAELFAHMVLNPRELAGLIGSRGDAVLRRKVDFLSDKLDRAIGLAVSLPR